MLREYTDSLQLKALLLEDYKSDAELIEYYLKESYPNCVITHVANEKDFKESIEKEIPDVILSDFYLPKYSALEAFSDVKAKHSEIPFIIITGNLPEEAAANLIKKGIDDYLLKSSLTRIGIAVGQALQRRNSLSKLKNSGQILESNLEFINAILDHSGIAICELEIPIYSEIITKAESIKPDYNSLHEFLSKLEICRVNKRVIELFEFKDFEHFENDFAQIFYNESVLEVTNIIRESISKKIVQNKRMCLKSFKGHKKHVNVNMVSRKVDNIISVIIRHINSYIAC